MVLGGRGKNGEKLLGAATPIMCGGACAAWLQTNDEGTGELYQGCQLTQKLGPRINIALKGQALVQALTTISPQPGTGGQAKIYSKFGSMAAKKLNFSFI